MPVEQLPWYMALPYQGGPQEASHVGQDDRSRLRINAARFRALLVQLRPASRRALGTRLTTEMSEVGRCCRKMWFFA
jgi:hypothetical protein